MSKNSKHLCQDFNLNQDQLKKVFLLPHEVAFEPYLKAFQYKVLNSVLFTNKCSLCKTDSKLLYHIFFAGTPSSFGRNFNITLTHWPENSSVWPYKTLLKEYYIQIALYWIIGYWSLNYTYEVVEEIRLFQSWLPFHPRLKLSMKQKSTNVLKLIKWTNLRRSGLCLWTLYPSVVCA